MLKILFGAVVAIMIGIIVHVRYFPQRSSDFNFDNLIETGQGGDDAQRCFNSFAGSTENGLNSGDFQNLIEALFPEVKGNEEHQEKIEKLFEKFSNGDKFISNDEFTWIWENWMKTVLWPSSAFIIVDVQNDFITGSLALSNTPGKQDGAEVVPLINEIINRKVPFATIVYIQDWHPENHISFFENLRLRKVIEINGYPVNDESELDAVKVFDTVTFEGPPRTEQRLWPKHCVQNTEGADFPADLISIDQITTEAIKIYKGTNENIDSYSAFFDNGKISETELYAELKSRGITDVYVCGLAYDVCVQSTAVHAAELGYRTVIIDDATRGIDLGDIRKAKETLKAKNCAIVQSSEVDSMVRAKNRKFILGFFLGINL